MPRRGKGEGSIIKRSASARGSEPAVRGIQPTPKEEGRSQAPYVQVAHRGENHGGHLEFRAWPAPVAVHSQREHGGLQGCAFVPVHEGVKLHEVKDDRSHLREEGRVGVPTAYGLKGLLQSGFERSTIAQPGRAARNPEHLFVKLKHRLRRWVFLALVAAVEAVPGHRSVLRENLQRLFVLPHLLLDEALHVGVRQLATPSCFLGFGFFNPNPEHRKTKNTTRRSHVPAR